jgi:hypothetical protein
MGAWLQDGLADSYVGRNVTLTFCLSEKLKEKEKLVAGPRWAPDTKTDWPTDCRS